MTPPIGISGFAKSGKTTAAEYLQREYGYTRLHIADPLRSMLGILLHCFGMDGQERQRYLEGDRKEDVIPCLGVSSRRAQITLGTEWGRELIHPDLWQRCWNARAEAKGGAVMNDSVRFPNEEAGIRALNGFTMLIVRPDVGPAAFKGPLGRWLYETFGVMRGVHDSERVDRLRPDFVIHNTGSLEDLYRMLDLAMEANDMAYGRPVPMVLRPRDALR